MNIAVSAVDAVLLPDGWHEVSDFDVGPAECIHGGQLALNGGCSTSPPGVEVVDDTRVAVAGTLSSIEAVRMCGDPVDRAAGIAGRLAELLPQPSHGGARSERRRRVDR